MSLLSFSVKAMLIFAAFTALAPAVSQGVSLAFISRFQYAGGLDILSTIPSG